MKQNQLIQFVQRLCKINYIPSRCVTLPCEDWSWCDLGLRSTILGMSSDEILCASPIKALLPRTIYHIVDGFQCMYSALLLDAQELLFCGPVMSEIITSSRMQQILQQQHIPDELHEIVTHYCHSISNNPINQHHEDVLIVLAEELFGKGNFKIEYISSTKPQAWHEFHSNQFHISDVPFENMRLIETRYHVENELLNAIRNANEEKALELETLFCQLIFPPRLVNLLRDQKDLSITMNSLLRKSAEQAGVHPIHIDSVSNSHVKQIEEITNLDQVNSLRRQIIKDYCELIRRYTLKNHSPMIQKVLTYIDTNLCADLSLKAFSEYLSINASYLSTLFKKEMGVSLTDYVNQKRILHAQRLLVATDLPIKTVANQCGIPDVYYFSRIFKKLSGITPKSFRETATFQDTIK
ncbi:MAG: helix-turn-helix domain-containing protein [Eubacteriales bacterium]|nr:helix-turn-helix domain-containing protein [Eubacteriales bacterium]